MSLLLARLLAYPATVAWSWWHRAGTVEYDGVPWPGESSAGTSSASTLDELVNPPAVGTALNGFDGALFFGGSAKLESTLTLGDILGSSPAGWTYFAVYQPASLAAAGSPTYDRPALIGDAGGWWGVAVDADGVTPFQPDGSNSNTIAAPTPAALTVGQPAIIVCRWTGTHLQVRVGATGSMTTGQVAMGDHFSPFSTIEGNAVFVGRNYASAAFLDGTLWEDALVPSSMSDGDVDTFCAELAARYGLGGGTVTGTLSRTLEALRLAATATVRAAGSLTRTLGNLLGTGTAGARVAGTLDRLLGPLDADGTAQALVSASLSATLGAGTCASTAAVAVTGSLDRTLGSAALSSTCVVGSTATATLGATLGAVTVTATATVRVAGACTAQLGAITGALTAAARVAGSCAATLGAVTGTGTAQARVAGSVAAQLGGLADDAQAVVRVAGTLNRALGTATLAASAVVPVVASVNAQLGWLTVASSAQVGSFVSASFDRGLGAVTVTATATVRVGASVDVTLGAVRAASTAAVLASASLDRALGSFGAAGAATVPVRATAAMALGAAAAAGSAIVPVRASATATLGSMALDALARPVAGATLAATLGAARANATAAARVGASAFVTVGPVLGTGTVELGVGIPDIPARITLAWTEGVGVRFAVAAGATLKLAVAPGFGVAFDVERAPVALTVTPGTTITFALENAMALNVGDDAVITGTFRTTGTNALADPTTLVAEVTPPRAPSFLVSYPSSAFVRVSLGVYQLTVDCTEDGPWRVSFRGTGAAKGAEPVDFTVDP